ncbi:MAG: sigma-70 family RNA polymerase sigma factor [Jiangellaceae bacterium]
MTEVHRTPDATRAVPPAETAEQLERYRRELTGYCYRMLGSAFDAEDAVQETLVRAWRGIDRFEGRSALRSWLYRIATNVCLDMLGGSQRRARPMDLGPAWSASSPVLTSLPEPTWITPVADDRVLVSGGDPADVALARESIRLAFVTALQQLPPRQRAVLILREVLSWSAAEVADLLDTTTASVNSALQRARATLATTQADEGDPLRPLDEEQQALLARYVDAFERYDLDALAALLREDARMTMPPLELWLSGVAEILTWLIGPGVGCRGSRLVPTYANGMPAFGQYKQAGREAWGLVVLETSGSRVTGINTYLDVDRLFPMFGLPMKVA